MDPALLTILAALLLFYLASTERFVRVSKRQRFYFIAGWLILGFSLIGPLCNLGVALFSARMAQHMLIAFIAAPLLILGGADNALLASARAAFSMKSRADARTSKTAIILKSLFFAAVFWLWHSGRLYDATLQNDMVYWIMELSIILASLMVWQVLLARGDAERLLVLAMSFLTGIQLDLLGALLTLTGEPWFAAHANTTWPWGLTPLEDQQFGGAEMWVVGGLFFVAYTLYAAAAVIFPADERCRGAL